MPKDSSLSRTETGIGPTQALKFRGEFYIHAGLRVDPFALNWIRETVRPERMPEPEDLKTGGLIGIAEVYDIVDRFDSPWFIGPKGLLLRNARPIEFIPCVGKLGFFEPDFNSRYKDKPEPKSKAPKKTAPATPVLPLLFQEQ